MKAKIVESFNYLKPKSKEEIWSAVKNMTKDQLRSRLYNAGMDFFDSSESEFTDFIYDTLEYEKVLSLFIGKKINREFNPYRDLGIGIQLPLSNIEAVKKFLNMSSYAYELDCIIKFLDKNDMIILLPIIDEEYRNAIQTI